MFVLDSRVPPYRAAVAALAFLAACVAWEPVLRADDQLVVVRREDAKFVPLDPSQPDLALVAVLRGDPATGPSSMLMRMKKSAGGLHYHTAGYDLVILEGQMKHWGERDSKDEAPTLGPGSYWHQPGLQAHGDSCLTEDCLMFITWEGKRDGIPGRPPQ